MKRLVFIIFLLSVSYIYCQKHFLTDAKYRAKVERKFEARKAEAKSRADKLFKVINSSLTVEETEALKFLYAYMPLCDLADYDGDFFLKQVRYALKARDTFSWGKIIPETVFRHFVLPYRVNNENLDTARIFFFNELKDRIKNLSLKEAALEVNYWCLERVTYRGADDRTSAPLATLRTALGRCGEESTFTVTAMRAVGIPARQVYTPRWAHSDDNHAWVEIWVDGKWQYMGACEPEPDLNIGWFTGPSKRAMLIHTKVFGDYPEKAEIVNKGENYSEINVLPNYADTKKIYIKVLDSNSKPVEGARVDFGLYNYAEFYPLASKLTTKDGLAYLTTGYGTLVIWASRNSEYAYKKITVADTDTLKLKLVKYDSKIKTLEYDLIPPVEKPVTNSAAQVDRQKHNDKVKAANDVREKYRASFIDSNSVFNFADPYKLSRELAWKYIRLSEGNYREIMRYYESACTESHSYVHGLLSQISEKDLRDTKASILFDHLYTALILQRSRNVDKDIFINYILNPRIRNENLIAYRDTLFSAFKPLTSLNQKDAVARVTEWIKKNIKINEKENYYNLPLSPVGVYELKVSNKESRDIFFVALCRSIGIPSRLEPKYKTPQYLLDNQWYNVYFEKQTQVQPEYGYLVLKGDGKSKIDPKYYTHFTIGKLENGAFKTIDFDTEPLLSSFKEPVKLEAGHYRLITGNRRSDGAVFSNVTFFDIQNGKTIEEVISLRDADNANQVLGKIDTGTKIEKNNISSDLLKYIKRDLVILGWVEPSKEPTRHSIVELKELNKRFEEWGGSILLFVTKENETDLFIKNNGEGLPANVSFVKDPKGALLNSVIDQLALKNNLSYPLFVIINKKGEIVFTSQGYKIGTGELLLKNVLK